MIPMTKEEAIKELNNQILLINSINLTDPKSDKFVDWKKQTEKVLSNIFNNDYHKEEFIKINYRATGMRFLSHNLNDNPRIKYFDEGLKKAKILLESFIEEINEKWKDDNSNVKDHSNLNYLNEIIEIKPKLFGLGININAIIKKYLNRRN